MSNRSEVSGAKREYRRVADELRASIEGGDIAFGEQLPTHAELVEQFDVSRATIQKALKALQDERYVQSIQGKGVFARDWNAPEPEGAPDVSHGTPSDALGLSEAIARSFTARHVTIDAYGLTSESLSAAIVPQVRQIMQGHPPPESIRVRLLLPVVDTRLAIAQACAYHRAARRHFPGIILSRANYDVAQGRDARGQWQSGVLEQSWRIGGASAAEIEAAAILLRQPQRQVVGALTMEIYGPHATAPPGAVVLFHGNDPHNGALLKYAQVIAHADS